MATARGVDVRGRRTVHSEYVFKLVGGNEDNDLWVYDMSDGITDIPVVCSVWVPTEEERERIAAGENIRLMIWGKPIPPVAMDLTDEPLGKRQRHG